MDLTTLLIGFIIATIYGAAFHLWRGGGAGKLLLFIIFAWFGFWAGQYLAEELKLEIWSLGSLHLGIATLFSFLFLFAVHWLSHIETKTKA